ncbi:glycogen/starch/alpha-glucan phosphorylase [Intestinibacillus sp. Marseille-P6563]|uniref:glycogen/starch/alpha-glucan phosphorylase n=1 Tax=Intestinibacillus sp. Marseille-P6563 TaxID=2364792 RepID=UPI000F0724D6|nr:glycogen/starch/alpha-glucan phosphorylase [Intestinibacillus sp. Marseille-P6563]
MKKQAIMEAIQFQLKSDYHTTPDHAKPEQLHMALSKAIMAEIADRWQESAAKHQNQRHAYYFSAEFLMGRMIYNNLLCLGVTKEVGELLEESGTSLEAFEEVEDCALGNGGLGRLAACFLDSAATLDLPLDGYGIRYKYGLFKQKIQGGFQLEEADDWTRFGDPWGLRREDEKVIVHFADQTIVAVPYDMPIIGYNTDNIGTLRLWQAEAEKPFDFNLFNEQQYDKSVSAANRAEDISRVLYPNDSTDAGKILRLKQQYFFCSASLQDIIRKYKKTYGNDFSHFAEMNAIQLNDTHPVISIPELIRLLTDGENLPFEQALDICKKVFAYTNHTILAEALEKWSQHLMIATIPRVYDIIVKVDEALGRELASKGVPGDKAQTMRIIQHETVHMAYMAIFASSYVNGVARLHTEILKNDALKDWYAVYPERFQNKTNGITQRRWLALCNPELSDLLTELLGNESWKTDLSQLKKLEKFVSDDAIMERVAQIKMDNHKRLADYIWKKDRIHIDPNTCFDIQIKRLHEYKRQFLNILAILEIYYEIKEGSLTDFTPTTFIFGAKSAPGYKRAKGIIKLINEVARVIDSDPAVRDLLKVVFVSNYNVSYAEKLVAAADISEQISTAGKEASGTGNMKLMANGAVTMGTYDGANIEIFEEAGEENNYRFGATVDEIRDVAERYNPNWTYHHDRRVKRILDALIDGTLHDGGSGIFRELHDSIVYGSAWHRPDQYFLLLDLDRYLEARKRASQDYKDRLGFARKCWMNICNSGKFSSDRTIAEYAKDIWHIEKVK